VLEFYIIVRSHFSTAFAGLSGTQLVFLQRLSVCYITQSNGINSYHIMRPDRREHYAIDKVYNRNENQCLTVV